MRSETSTTPDPGRAVEGADVADRVPVPKPARRFTLSLRALIFIVLILGAWLGWFVRNARIQHDAVAAVQRAGGSVGYDIDWRNAGPSPYAKPWTPMRLLDGKLWGTKWLIDHLGIDYFGSVVTVDLIPSRFNCPHRADDATIALIGQLGRLDSLRLTGTAVTDAGLAHLKDLTGLRDLQLGSTQITDAGLAHLEGLIELRSLLLFGTTITDAGIGHLKKLPQLVLLDVTGTRVTDDGVLELERASSLPRSAGEGVRERELRRALRGIPIQVLREEDMGLYNAQARALKDLDFALSRPFRLACLLLANRARVMANRGEKAELIATCNAVCGLEADDKVSLLKLAQCCSECVKSLDSSMARVLSDQERRSLKQRCTDRGIAALSRAVELGLRSVPHLEQLEEFRGQPGYEALIEKIKAAGGGK
jgi:hypothetical protein